MLTWLTRLANTRKKATAPRRRTRRLALEWLEAREVPALTIQLDYSPDAGGHDRGVRRRPGARRDRGGRGRQRRVQRQRVRQLARRPADPRRPGVLAVGREHRVRRDD